MEKLITSLEKFILNPKYRVPLSIIKGFRNGAVYGAKIRFPHALVMTFLFRGGRYCFLKFFLFKNNGIFFAFLLV